MGVKIIIIDDDFEDVELLMKAITETNQSHICSFYCNPLDAVNSLIDNLEEIPDFIFLDLYMPLMQGDECLRTLKRLSHLKDVCYVMLSTSIQNDQVERFINDGATHAFAKPVNMHSYYDMVKQIL